MRKNFFKKLSFVLALAMIVSVIAPAAGVFADTGLKLNSKDKTLHLAQPGKKNKFNFNIDGEKQKGWKYLWISSNEDVAEVNEKNGVTTAVGIGTANITVVITDKNGAEVDRLTAKVTVKDNIKTVAIKNPPTEPIPVGEEYDFDRSFVTYSGVTEKTGKTTAITRWEVTGENKDKATIEDSSGKFTATEAGKYTVVARSFQSKAKYNEWKESGDASLVLDEDSVEVTVKPSIKEVKQYDPSTATVVFDSNMKEAGLKPETAKFYKIVNGKDVETGAEKIKEITLDDSGKKATVKVYGAFESEVEYKFVFGELTDNFKAAKIDPKEVALIEFNDNITANINGKATDLVDNIVGKNSEGVIIFYGDSDSTDSLVQQFNGSLSFKLADSADVHKVHLDKSYIYVYEKGYVAPVNATYEYYYYDSTDNEVKKVAVSTSGTVTGVDVDYVLDTTSLQFAISNALDENGANVRPDTTNDNLWKAPYAIPAGEQNYKIFARYKNLVQQPWESPLYDDNGSKFRYESTNTDILITYSYGNDIQPIGEGVVTVLVHDRENNDKIVGALEITVKSARGFASVVANPSYVIINNNEAYGNDFGTVATYLVSKDTMGGNFTPSQKVIDYEPLSVPTVNDVEGALSFNFDGVYNAPWDSKHLAIELKVNAKGPNAVPGVYRYKFTLANIDAYGNWQQRDVHVTFDVKDARGANANIDKFATFKLELDETTTDLRYTGAKNVGIKVGVYNKYGVKIAELDDATEYDVTITGPYGIDGRYDDTKIETVIVEGVSPSVLRPLAVGKYVVSAKATKDIKTNDGKNITVKNKGAALGSVTYTVTDSNERTFTVEKRIVSSDNIFNIVKDAFSLKLNGGENENIYEVTYYIGTGRYVATLNDFASHKVAAGNSVRIYEVKTYSDNPYKIHTYSPNVTLEVR